MADYGPFYEDAGRQWQIDPLLLQAVAGKESDQNPNAVGRAVTLPDGSVVHAAGIMQFLPDTATQYNVDPSDPRSSIFGAANYLDDLLKKHNGNLAAALSDYGGDKSGAYAQDVMGRYAGLQQAWGTAPPAAGTPYADYWTALPGQPANWALTPAGKAVLGNPGTAVSRTQANPSPGWENANIVGVPVPGTNNTVRVNKIIAPNVAGFLGNLADIGYPLTDVQGYFLRPNTNNPSLLSSHSFGTSFDINPDENPNQSTATTMPPIVRDIAAKWGFKWGLDFSPTPDPMHFEWMGIDPAGGMDYRSGKPVALAGAAPAPQPTDYGRLFPPAPVASGGPAAVADKPADYGALFGPPSNLSTPQQAASAAPPVADPEIYPTPVYTPPSVTAGGPAPNWWQRNIADPASAMWSPTPAAQQPSQNYLLGSPLAQSVGAGFLQGPRDVAQTVTGWVRDADKNYPWLANVDQTVKSALPSWVPLVGGPDAAETNRNLTEASATNQQQYGSSLPFGAARLAGDIAATSQPAGWIARGVGATGRLVPGVIGRVAGGAGEGAVAGGMQNALTSPDLAPGTAFQYGAIGGAGVGGTLGALGGRTASPVADQLGIDLSRGQTGGALARRIEDTTAPFPGSGAAPFAQQQRQQIADVIAREAGMPVGQPITTGGLNEAERRVGSSIETAAQNITVPGGPLFANLPAIESAAVQAGPNTPQAHTFRNLSDQLLNLISNNGGVVPGDQFARFIARGGPLDVARNSSVPEVRAVGNQIREALLDAGAQGTPQTAQALQDLGDARYQWKVLQTVRPAIDRAAGGTEEMSLPGLANSIRNNFDPRIGGNMYNLAQLISGPLRTLPSSGTAERSLWQHLLSGGLELGGVGAAGASLFGALPAAGAFGLGALAPAVIGRASRFGAGLGNPLIGAAREVYNPLMPRMVGPALGTNWLASQPQPATP